jgi:hypothetical protein
LPLKDFLLPNENVRFQSVSSVEYAGRAYRVIITDKRLILYSRNGLMFKSDNVATESLKDIQGIHYKEQGIVMKKGILTILGNTKIDLIGSPPEVKAIYQNLSYLITKK